MTLLLIPSVNSGTVSNLRLSTCESEITIERIKTTLAHESKAYELYHTLRDKSKSPCLL